MRSLCLQNFIFMLEFIYSQNNITKRENMINLKDYLRGDEVFYTEAFQKAIDDASASKQTLFIPVGEYLLGTVELKSNVSIIFEDGAKLIGSKNLEDFYEDKLMSEPCYQDLSHSSYTKSLFYGTNIENVSLKGRAVIDMQSAWAPKESKRTGHRGAKAISITYGENLRFEDFEILNATDIALLLGACKQVFIRGLYIKSHIDGISPDGCEDVIISDCNLFCGDDALVFKTSLFDGQVHHLKRVTVSNCIISSRCNAIKFGTESTGDMKYITISNCVVHHAQATGISIESVDGANLEAINISDIMMENVTCPLFIALGRRMRAPEGTPIGSIKNVTISNVYADNSDEVYKSIDFYYIYIKEGSEYEQNGCIASSIVNLTDNPLENVTLNNVHFKVMGDKKLEDVDYKENPTGYPTHWMNGFVLPAYGMLVKGVKNLKLNDVTFETIKPDERPALEVID